MKKIPDSVKDARLINTATGKEFVLETKPESCCHFVAERIKCGKFDVQIRIDWSDTDGKGDPTLDADFYYPGETKRQNKSRFKKVHHTKRKFDGKCWIYDFSFEGLELNLLLNLTKEVNCTMSSYIV